MLPLRVGWIPQPLCGQGSIAVRLPRLRQSRSSSMCSQVFPLELSVCLVGRGLSIDRSTPMRSGLPSHISVAPPIEPLRADRFRFFSAELLQRERVEEVSVTHFAFEATLASILRYPLGVWLLGLLHIKRACEACARFCSCPFVGERELHVTRSNSQI